jgi:hypothetical protein
MAGDWFTGYPFKSFNTLNRSNRRIRMGIGRLEHVKQFEQLELFENYFCLVSQIL